MLMFVTARADPVASGWTKLLKNTHKTQFLPELIELRNVLGI